MTCCRAACCAASPPAPAAACPSPTVVPPPRPTASMPTYTHTHLSLLCAAARRTLATSSARSPPCASARPPTSPATTAPRWCPAPGARWCARCDGRDGRSQRRPERGAAQRAAGPACCMREELLRPVRAEPLHLPSPSHPHACAQPPADCHGAHGGLGRRPGALHCRAPCGLPRCYCAAAGALQM